MKAVIWSALELMMQNDMERGNTASDSALAAWLAWNIQMTRYEEAYESSSLQ